jgi:UDP-glucuronate 4-epimerase
MTQVRTVGVTLDPDIATHDSSVNIVTGVAGFIGSHLAEALLARGCRVRGIDCLTPYYSEDLKRTNLSGLAGNSAFEFVEADLRSADLEATFAGASRIFHQAAQPGVRLSWSHGFAEYVSCNILATQRLLEAAIQCGISRVVYASSSSVYGNAVRYPTAEKDLPRPLSPYGVTKLAGEQLAGLYAENHGLSSVSLRYFTVYGPRQRPDMAIHRLIESALHGQAFPLYGSGNQVRDFTFVADVVRANIAAGFEPISPGTVVNICASGSTKVNDLIDAVSEAVGKRVNVEKRPPQPGDVARTGGDASAAEALLGWQARTRLSDGIAQQVEWHRSLSGKRPH